MIISFRGMFCIRIMIIRSFMFFSLLLRRIISFWLILGKWVCISKMLVIFINIVVYRTDIFFRNMVKVIIVKINSVFIFGCFVIKTVIFII